MAERLWADAPWEHPDWYDLHDTAWTAGPEREPEHYRECVLALPPLDRSDHLLDAGAGTGKLAQLIGQSYPHLGKVTLLEPNGAKLARARQRLQSLLPDAQITPLEASLGIGHTLPENMASVAAVGSVLMPIMLYRGGTLADGMQWLHRALDDLHRMMQVGASLFVVETLAEPWAQGELHDPVRRLTLTELLAALASGDFVHQEVVYRFRDRVVLRMQKTSS